MKNKLFHAAASALLTLLLVVTLLPVQAHAAGATLTGTAAPQAGDTVTLTLSVPNKVYGLTADLSYSGNLSFTNYNCSVSGWSIVVNNNKFSVYGTSSSSGGLVTIKMKVSGSAKEGDALTATFSNIVVSDGNIDTSLDSASWSGKVGAAPSGNCSLSSLSCSNATLSPSFSSSTTYYTCTVPFAVEKLDLNYKKADNSATVSVSGNELAVGVNTVTIKVTAANGATKSYTIDATRQQDPNYKPSTDASIAALTLEGATLSPAFTPTVTDYIAYVPYETKQVTIAATAKDEKAQGITGTGEVRLSATEAETVLTVTGTAEDGKTKQNYTIHVLRMPAYTGIVPTVEVIDPATIPEVPPLEPGLVAVAQTYHIDLEADPEGKLLRESITNASTGFATHDSKDTRLAALIDKSLDMGRFDAACVAAVLLFDQHKREGKLMHIARSAAKDCATLPWGAFAAKAMKDPGVQTDAHFLLNARWRECPRP